MPITAATRQWLIVSDLDGSLLDHHNYSFAAAEPLLAVLAQAGVDVALCTSKTRAEVTVLREKLGNASPFIVENGAAVYLPKSSFPTCPADATDAGDYWLRSFCEPRSHWLALVERLKQHSDADFTHFAAMSTAEVAAATGLSLAEAGQACQREFGEPLLWRDSEEKLAQVSDWLRQQGATVLAGGRFVHVCGDADKGQALKWLAQQCAQREPDKQFITMALGDSGNDVAMLEAADFAVVIRSPVKAPPELRRQEGAYFTRDCGPVGWVEGVGHWFSTLRNEVPAPPLPVRDQNNT
ncbi:mannosyl-3-phosphoglycerate phosphatase [Pseudomaricurvus sp. HS19]|uniref:HAD-IIB family hydrolase n=1 Tax=Pseudomaricurvus sp. HS19 TaxID=2692626 RepID=UPI0019256F33|nr:HAD-IIB family hydrolase [Pseudomaricurvus sp. HS19]